MAGGANACKRILGSSPNWEIVGELNKENLAKSRYIWIFLQTPNRLVYFVGTLLVGTVPLGLAYWTRFICVSVSVTSLKSFGLDSGLVAARVGAALFGSIASAYRWIHKWTDSIENPVYCNLITILKFCLRPNITGNLFTSWANFD